MKTHRERARGAAYKTWKRAGEPDGLTVETIARLTFPAELVEAARTMGRTFCDSHEFCMDDPDGLLPRSHHPDCIALRAALEAYKEKP